jgi:MFS family permease
VDPLRDRGRPAHVDRKDGFVIATIKGFASFGRPAQVLFINQVGINIGFYMLMPYLADHLTSSAGMAVWTVGLILGVRNFTQQGMFLIGGTLADRLGYKPMIMLGCALRTVGFAFFALSTAVPVLIAASALTGFAGALFNPAARAYLAHEESERRVEAFALFNVFYQTGILIGPLAGILLLKMDFRLVCLTAAAIFAILTALQWRHLPARAGAEADTDRPVLTDWREAFANRAFIGFAAAMIASYALSFQVYLGLPLEVRRVTGDEWGVVALFAISAVLGMAGQLRLTAWCKRRWSPGQAMAYGLAVMGLSFTPLAAGEWFTGPLRLFPMLACAALLAIGTMMVFPFEMATIASLSGGRLIGTYYGLYNLLSGLGILAGNLSQSGPRTKHRCHNRPMAAAPGRWPAVRTQRPPPGPQRSAGPRHHATLGPPAGYRTLTTAPTIWPSSASFAATCSLDCRTALEATHREHACDMGDGIISRAGHEEAPWAPSTLADIDDLGQPGSELAPHNGTGGPPTSRPTPHCNVQAALPQRLLTSLVYLHPPAH